MISPFVLRRTKNEVLKDLPDKIENTVLVDFSEDEKKLYLAHLAQANQLLKTLDGSRQYSDSCDVDKVKADLL